MVDDDRRPAADVTVSLEGTSIVAVTDSIGRFSLTGVPEGRYDVSVRAGCRLAGYHESLRVPRPIAVPVPIIATRVDCVTPVGDRLSRAEEGELIGRALALAIRPERRGLAGALLADGAFEIVNANGRATSARLPDETEIRVGLPPDPSAPPRPTPGHQVAVCFTVPDPETAVVRLVRTTPPLAEEARMLDADAALFVFLREGASWRLLQQILCRDDARDAPRVRAEGSGGE